MELGSVKGNEKYESTIMNHQRERLIGKEQSQKKKRKKRREMCVCME
jgi:hypothetical protein